MGLLAHEVKNREYRKSVK